METTKTLYLTLKKSPFEVMAIGEKKEEFRLPTSWIMSRLIDKEGNKKPYDNVKFVNGYGSDKPFFLADYKGYEIVKSKQKIRYSNGLEVIVNKGDVKILLGSVFYKSNILFFCDKIKNTCIDSDDCKNCLHHE